jgi:hypothetical protein
MKTAFTLVSVLLAASPALAGLIPSNGVLPGTPPSRRDAAQGRDVSDRAGRPIRHKESHFKHANFDKLAMKIMSFALS